MIDVDLGAVVHAPAVGVGLEGVGSVNADLGAIRQTVAVGIRLARVRVHVVHLLAIRQTVPVRVGVPRICPGRLLFQVRQPVIVRIPSLLAGGQRVEPVLHFESVQESVSVGVRVVRVRPQLQLVVVAQAVVIPVRNRLNEGQVIHDQKRSGEREHDFRDIRPRDRQSLQVRVGGRRGRCDQSVLLIERLHRDHTARVMADIDLDAGRRRVERQGFRTPWRSAIREYRVEIEGQEIRAAVAGHAEAAALIENGAAAFLPGTGELHAQR